MSAENIIYLLLAIIGQTPTTEPAVVTADHMLQTQRAIAAAIGDYEAEVTVDITYMAESVKTNNQEVWTPKSVSNYKTIHPGRYRWRESGKRFYCKVLRCEEGAGMYRQSLCYDGSRFEVSDDPELRLGHVKSVPANEIRALRNGVKNRCPLRLAFFDENKPFPGGEKYTKLENGFYFPLKFKAASQYEFINGFKTLKMSLSYGSWHKPRTDSSDSEANFRPDYLHSCWWLDPGAGWMPRRIEGYAEGKTKILNVLFEIIKYKQVEEGVWFPVEGTITAHRIDQNGNVIPSQKTKIVVDENTIKTKQNFDNRKFVLDWPIGARVRDEDTGKMIDYGVPTSETKPTK